MTTSEINLFLVLLVESDCANKKFDTIINNNKLHLNSQYIIIVC